MWLIYACFAAVCFGFRGILYQWTSQKPINRNMMLFGVYVCGAIIATLANLFFGQVWTVGSFLGILMGVLSFASNASMYKGFAVGKASLVAILSGMTPIVVVGLAYALWGETLSAGQLVSFVIIVSGILLIRYSSDLTLTNLKGVHWALLAMLFFGFTDVTTKQATLWGGETLPILSLMYSTGAIMFGLLAFKDWKASRIQWAAQLETQRIMMEHAATVQSDMEVAPQTSTPDASSHSVAEQPKKLWSYGKMFNWGLFVGLSNISGMLLIIPAFRLGITGLVSAVVAMSVLIILLYARFFLKEKFRKLEVAGMTLAIVGMLLLRLLG